MLSNLIIHDRILLNDDLLTEKRHAHGLVLKFVIDH